MIIMPGKNLQFLILNNSVKGKALAQMILEELRSPGLCTNNCWGQGYYGNEAIAGKAKGYTSSIRAVLQIDLVSTFFNFW